jgi:ribosomal protein uL22
MTYGYTVKDMNETRAHAVMMDVPISYKVAVLVSKKIKGMTAQKAVVFLQDVQSKKRAVPYTKFNDSVGHKPGSLGPGRYPEKAAKLFEGLVKSAIANAEDRDLGSDVWVEFCVPQQASRPWHSGRVGRRKFKRSHVEIVLTNAPHPKTVKKQARKVSAKPAEHKTKEKKTHAEKY